MLLLSNCGNILVRIRNVVFSGLELHDGKRCFLILVRLGTVSAASWRSGGGSSSALIKKTETGGAAGELTRADERSPPDHRSSINTCGD